MADQYLDPAMLQYLFEQGTGSSPGSMLARPENTDDWGTLDEQGARLTQLSKASNLQANPNYVVGLGQQGYSPEAFQPVTSYTPINTKGRDQLQLWAAGNDPLRKFIGESLLNGASPGQVQSQLQVILSRPEGDPLRDSYFGSVPNAVKIDPMTGAQTPIPGGVDWNTLYKTVDSAYNDLLKDDPWDGQTVDEQGRPAAAKQEDSEAMQALKSMGFTVTPYDEFTQEQLAPEGLLEMQQQRLDPLIRENVANIEGTAAARRRSDEMVPQYEKALQDSMARTAFQNAGGLAPPATAAPARPAASSMDARNEANNTNALTQERSILPGFGATWNALANYFGSGNEPQPDRTPRQEQAAQSMLAPRSSAPSPLMDAMLGVAGGRGGARQPTPEEKERQRLRAAILRQKGDVLTGQQNLGRSKLALSQQSDKDWLGEQQRLGAIEQLRAQGITPFSVQQQAMNRMLLG
jgi:hypothetical protein